MDFAQHVDAFEREKRGARGRAPCSGPDAPVPSCPEWTAADLAQHVGEFAGWWTHIIQDGAGQEHDEIPACPEPAGRPDWAERNLARMHELLADAGPELEVWTWTDDHSTGFVARRAAHELAIHRYDAELAAGTPSPVEGELAVDGIEEIFAMIPFRQRDDVDVDPPVTVHLHATDRDGEWLVALVGNGIDVIREHAKGDLAIRGTASDLELALRPSAARRGPALRRRVRPRRLEADLHILTGFRGDVPHDGTPQEAYRFPRYREVRTCPQCGNASTSGWAGAEKTTSPPTNRTRSRPRVRACPRTSPSSPRSKVRKTTRPERA